MNVYINSKMQISRDENEHDYWSKNKFLESNSRFIIFYLLNMKKSDTTMHNTTCIDYSNEGFTKRIIWVIQMINFSELKI